MNFRNTFSLDLPEDNSPDDLDYVGRGDPNFLPG